MVLHLYQWNHPPYLRIVRLTDEEWAMVLLSGYHPPFKNKHYCLCPRIGQKYCELCFGERIYYHVPDSKKLQGVIK